MVDQMAAAQEVFSRLRDDGYYYYEIVDELAEHWDDESGPWSKAAWSKLERGLLVLSRDAANALLRYAGLPDIPKPPAQIVDEAGVEQVLTCSDRPDTAVLIGSEVHEVILGTNGSNRDSRSLPGVSVTKVTGPKRHRKPRTGITVSKCLGNALRAQKRRLGGLTWEEFLERVTELDDSLFLAGVDGESAEMAG